MADDLLLARGLVVAYGRPGSLVARRGDAPVVLHGVDIRVGKGETVGIVGECGSGKTTLGRALLGLIKPAAGSDASSTAATSPRSTNVPGGRCAGACR